VSIEADSLARRYVAWLRRRVVAIVAAHAIVFAAAVYLIAYRLPLYADFSYLLPQDAPAVRDLRKLEARVKTTDTVLVIVRAPSAGLRAAAEAAMTADARAIAPELVLRVDGDDAAARAYFRAHRHLFVPLADLSRAQTALRRRIADAKLAANPLYVQLDDDRSEAKRDRAELDDLRAKRRDAEQKLDRPSNISPDGLAALVQVRTAFAGTDVGRGEALLGALDTARARVIAAHPGVQIGFAGGIVTALAEHRAIVSGTLLSSIVTAVLVALLLAVYFRSATLLVLLVGTVGIATAAAFGVAVFTVGHLNAATAFLGAIIAGNGINYGILLIARYLEERRSADVDAALAAAIAGTLRPTAVASLGAAIAYGSLAATSFRGFADFAVIGAIGMLLCWIASFALLPALILRVGRTTRSYQGDTFIGSILVFVLGFAHPRRVVAVAGVIGAVAIAIVVQFVAGDPFEYDLRRLRSTGADATTERRWMKISDKAFGRGFAGRTVVAADRLDQVPQLVAALRALDRDKPPAERTIGSIESILDVVPEHQPEKLAALADLRAQLDDPALDALDDTERNELAELRPPDDLRALGTADLPPSLRDKLAERDGRVGYIVSIRPADRLDELDGHDLIRFATAVRRVELPGGTEITTSGTSVIFADIITTIARDGPIVTAIAGAGLVVLVALLVGRNRRAVAVLAATSGGTLLMAAACALVGLKVNFLDFVALPITLGLGVDYAINVAHRHDSSAIPDPIATLRTSGSAVFVCSLTTMIGYGSLLVSDNLAISGFGTASLIGEVTSVLAALVLVPALLAMRSRAGSRSQPDSARS
jgi:predicted RND superfamily exporter protein